MKHMPSNPAQKPSPPKSLRDVSAERGAAAEQLVPVLFLGETPITPSAASRLALRLGERGEDALAQRLGVAVDHLRPRVRLAKRDRRAISRVLSDNCPPDLEALRAALAASLTRPVA
jgi:hypothetical protein